MSTVFDIVEPVTFYSLKFASISYTIFFIILFIGAVYLPHTEGMGFKT